MAPNKLYIYDSTSEADVAQADGRFDDDDEVISLGIPSRDVLVGALNGLLARRLTFSRVLFQTHGAAGCIKFNGMSIYDTTLKEYFAGKGYHALFPSYTRFYFDGCNVAEGTLGTEFFLKVGEIFLKLGGGEVFGYTSPGYGLSGWIPFLGGHTMHFSGELKKLYFKPGGVRFTPEPVPYKEPVSTRRDYIGHNI